MRNKLILFDWGNIVESHTTGFSCIDAWNELFKACGYKGNENVSSLLKKYKLTRITSINDFESTYNEFSKEFNLSTNFLEFIELYKHFFDRIDYYPEVADYEKSLKDKCYIGILSNLNIFDKERLDKQVDLSKYDYVFLSFELGFKKPEKDIYLKINENVPFSPENILFIDDRQDNIDMAKECGWNVLRATGLELEKIKACCEKFING